MDNQSAAPSTAPGATGRRHPEQESSMDRIENLNDQVESANDDDSFRERDMSGQETFEDIVEQHLSRRLLLGGAAALPLLTMPGLLPGGSDGAAYAQSAGLTFQSLPETVSRDASGNHVTASDVVTVPPGYRFNVVIKWGDPLFPGVGAFDVNNQTPADARQRFGFNNDMIALFPERFGAPATIGRLPFPSYIMATNHEYVTPPTLFPGVTTNTVTDADRQAVLFEYVGVGIVRIALQNGNWVYDQNSRFNRRITLTTPIDITGPAAGHPKLQTPADPNGRRALGTYNNCAGGFTPWGTYLSAEENFNFIFDHHLGTPVADPTILQDHVDVGARPGVVGSEYGRNFPRFNLSTPEGRNEIYRFGWVVEVDPYNPTSTPAKRTALGRFKHECATVALTQNDGVVLYSGDDERFEYVYKFIAANRFDRSNPRSSANMSLLDSGTIYAARFNADGTGQWLALDINNPATGPLIRASVYANGTPRFPTQADVLINTRRAGDAVGATPMDRPEDVEAPVDASFRGSGRVYFTCTNNSSRTANGLPTNSDARRTGSGRQIINQTDAANPRRLGIGHIIEIIEAGNDHAALTFTWRVFMLAGDPANPNGFVPAGRNVAGGSLNVGNTYTGPRFSAPDNVAFDKLGNLWIATDGSPEILNQNDQILAAPTNVPPGQPIPLSRFLTAPNGAECCGPLMTPDNSTMMVAFQHPGEDGARVFNNPQSTWPDNLPGSTIPAAQRFPKSAVIAVRRLDGGRIGS
jgi:uncharacterized protein